MPSFRLAMRAEGDKWTAYVAKGDTMEGAIWMGSIAMGIVTSDMARKRAFMDLMIGALDDFLADQGMTVESWDERDAPEHERSGSA